MRYDNAVFGGQDHGGGWEGVVDATPIAAPLAGKADVASFVYLADCGCTSVDRVMVVRSAVSSGRDEDRNCSLAIFFAISMWAGLGPEPLSHPDNDGPVRFLVMVVGVLVGLIGAWVAYVSGLFATGD